MTYREKLQLFNDLTAAMDRRDWAEALQLAEALYAAQPSDRRMYEAILAALIDGQGGPARAAQIAADYAAHFGRASVWGPMDGVAQFYLGRVALLADDGAAAEQHLQAALADESMPEWYRGAACSIYATLCRQLGRIEQAVELFRRSSDYKDLAHGKAAEYSNYLFNLHYLAKPPEFMYEAAIGYGKLFAAIKPYGYDRAKLKARWQKRGKLRLGYISPDLHFHVVAFFSYAFFHSYDHELFEVYCYTDCLEDGASREFAAITDKWRNVRGLPPDEVARIVHADEIDILIDLAGHTANNFLPVLACKPAPVQVSGIGYFGTTGLPAVDYFLADHYTDPEDVPEPNDKWFVEKLLRLPQSHFCFMWHDAPDYPGPAPCRRNGYITFGSFNNFAKVSDAVLQVWSEIMRQVPDSRLYLKAAVFNKPYTAEAAKKRIAAAGIDLARVILGEQEPKYLRHYHEMDIALDTFPYPGGGTTCDALYMGVPVVTLVGERHGARFGGSLLTNVGHEELCAADVAEYIRIAVELAHDTERLCRYHDTLRWDMQRSPVMQSADYMAAVEQAYMRIWLDYVEADMPEAARAMDIAEKCLRLQSCSQTDDWNQVRQLALEIIAGTADKRNLAMAYAAGAMAQYERSRNTRHDWGRTSWWLQQALAYDTEHRAELYRMLAEARMSLGNFVGCRDAARQGLQELGTVAESSAPSDFRMDLLAKLAHGESGMGENEAGAADYMRASQAAEHLPDRCHMYSSALLTMHHYYGDTTEDIRALNAAHMGYNDLLRDAEILPELSPIELSQRLAARPDHRLRIGYLSPDFRNQVMFYFYYQLLVGHTTDAFEIYAYALNSRQDGFTELVRGAVNHYVDCSGRRDDYAGLARRIRDDGIDVLVDLAGHVAGGGLPVLAYRPAPVQLAGIGYIHPTGLRGVDGFITDSYADPPEDEADTWAGLHERPVRLTSQFCYTGRSDVPEPVGAPCRAKGYVTFGVFNRYSKITDKMIGLWREIMQAVPGSRLLLKNPQANTPQGCLAEYERLAALGLDMSRVEIEGTTANYMERYLDVDIALDTYPYVGGGTTCDALYMGVPVVSLYGRRHGDRLGLSILMNAGVGELAVATPTEYVARAVALARDADLLDVLHRNLRSMMMGAPLMNTKQYVAELEEQYIYLWQRMVVRGENGKG